MNHNTIKLQGLKKDIHFACWSWGP